MGQYLKGNNMAPKQKNIMAHKRMHKFLRLITPIWIKIQLSF